jgi:hypothetical protein
VAQILAIKFFIAVWKHTLTISSKLKARTWVFLAVFHACVAVVSFWAYQARSVSESAIPPIYHAELKPIPLPDPQRIEISSGSFTLHSMGNTSWEGSVVILSDLSQSPKISGYGHLSILAHERGSFNLVLGGSGYHQSYVYLVHGGHKK